MHGRCFYVARFPTCISRRISTNTGINRGIRKSFAFNQYLPSTQRRNEREENELTPSIPYTTAASEFLYGISAVTAALKAQRRKLYKLYLHQRALESTKSRDLQDWDRLLRSSNVEVRRVPQKWLKAFDKISGGKPHNGCILEVSPLPRIPITSLGPCYARNFGVKLDHQFREELEINGMDELFPYSSEGWRKPFILFLYGIMDPGNLGAILRTAYFVGVDGVAIAKRKSAQIDSIAAKAASGAAEAIRLFSIRNPEEFLSKSAQNGWSIHAAEATPKAQSPRNYDPGQVVFNKNGHSESLNNFFPLATQPSILMLGGEGEGLPRSFTRKAQYSVSITQANDRYSIGLDSLNVSVAAAVLMAEFLKRPPGAAQELGPGRLF